MPEQCPVDFPKVFDHGRSCCRYDKDNEDKIIDEHSPTCKYNAYRPCQKDHCIDNGSNHDYIITALQKWIMYLVIRYFSQICNLIIVHT